MEVFFKDWIKNILVLVIFITAVDVILPNGSTKKYVNLVVGILVIIVIINPILLLVKGDINIEGEIIRTSTILDTNILALKKDNIKFDQEEQIIRVYKNKLEGHIKDRISKDYAVTVNEVDAEIIKDTSSDNFGTIKNIKVGISFKENDKNDLNRIEKIYINVSNNKGENVKAEKNKSKEIDKIKKEIALFYDLDDTNITIINEN
ncbi:stage III sporulation protein AF [Anaeromicrobium sediminis]|uniref:Stage III sporulation protein AF n=1 Tax=Anaeromicrobium sediminis TaxID=1478221 RepID=A0A267MMY1_9FIRM|nr:stage III sporulation protein AF [Anaeromicrobium sediminis]PAB60961.1 stage III sporulation protein AF [Anaeromicrobium sediminis]